MPASSSSAASSRTGVLKRSSLLPTLLIAGFAVVVAISHRAWIAADPCNRMSRNQLAEAFPDLSFKHDQEMRQLHALYELDRSSKTSPSVTPQQVESDQSSYAKEANAIVELAQRQHEQIDRACRSANPK